MNIAGRRLRWEWVQYALTALPVLCLAGWFGTASALGVAESRPPDSFLACLAAGGLPLRGGLVPLTLVALLSPLLWAPLTVALLLRQPRLRVLFYELFYVSGWAVLAWESWRVALGLLSD